MASKVIHLLLPVLFLFLIPYPRRKICEVGFVILVAYGVAALFIVGQFLKPFFDLLKVDVQSKLVSGAIVISTVSPRVGKYILSREYGVWRIRHAFNSNIGEEMVRFRRDLRKMYVTNTEIAEGTLDKGELLADIKRTHSQIQRRHAVGEILVGVGVGIIALLVGQVSFLAGVGLMLSIYMLIFPLSMALRSVVVDTLAFSAEMVDVESESVQYPPQPATLGFMQGWNRMLLTNEAVIHKLILLSFTMGEFVLGYERGEQLIEEVLTGELELEEAFDKLVNEELGEETVESRWIRQMIEKFLGV
ncbi:hypothetical protein [Halobellus inordinatus]|uniref:hypothetical protein n=1 Tax=Halobellus inordinatus TaxID=1126236 RepID=UPI002113AD41|nr:hypothetical protein [Halobellus ramosii]